MPETIPEAYTRLEPKYHVFTEKTQMTVNKGLLLKGGDPAAHSGFHSCLPVQGLQNIRQHAHTTCDYERATHGRHNKPMGPGTFHSLQAAPMPPMIGTIISGPGFGPPICGIDSGVWATDLDRILVLSVEICGKVTIWLRLIGLGQALNFKLNAPTLDSPVAAMEVSAESKPE